MKFSEIRTIAAPLLTTKSGRDRYCSSSSTLFRWRSKSQLYRFLISALVFYFSVDTIKAPIFSSASRLNCYAMASASVPKIVWVSTLLIQYVIATLQQPCLKLLICYLFMELMLILMIICDGTRFLRWFSTVEAIFLHCYALRKRLKNTVWTWLRQLMVGTCWCCLFYETQLPAGFYQCHPVLDWTRDSR